MADHSEGCGNDLAIAQERTVATREPSQLRGLGPDGRVSTIAEQRVERLAYGYELMHVAICHMAGTSGADGRWYMLKAQEVLARVSPVFAITPESNAHKPGDCLREYRKAVPKAARDDSVAALEAARQALWQYMSDLRFPPVGDSIERRLAAAETACQTVAAALASAQAPK